jgi:DNA-binding transcriptional regulator LsrR (DeoR family)
VAVSEHIDAAGPGPAADHRLAAAIARRYYLHDESQVSIAADLGISRFKVARLLEWARAEGIVRIEVAEPEVDVALSKSLANALGIERALVLDTVESDPRTAQIGVLAARHLASAVPPHGVLGLAWSRATQALTEHLAGIPDATVVQLCGALTHAAGEEQSVELVRRAAANIGGKALTFYAPLVLDDAATAGSLRRQVGIIDVLRQCDSLSVAVIAVGMWAPGCSTVYDALSVHDRMTFAERGAVAESSGILFDASGAVLREGLQDRVVAVTEAQLRRAGEVVALATEAERIPAVYALTRSGIVTTLITHRQLAEHIVADVGDRA